MCNLDRNNQTLRYLLILVIVLLLILPYNHISSQSYYIHNIPYFQDNCSHSLHTNSSQTNYYLTSNISISNGSSYSIHNTHFIVTGNYSIVDLGTLCITNVNRYLENTECYRYHAIAMKYYYRVKSAKGQ